MKKIVFTALLFAFSILFAQEDFSKASLYKADINSQTAYNMQQKGIILIDVRTKREFASSHPKGAINIPLLYEKSGQQVFNQDFIKQVGQALEGNIKQEVILICRSGSRTKYAANLLANDGFSNVYNIAQGFAYDWSKVNLPIEK